MVLRAGIGEELLVALAGWVVSAPGEARRWCLVSQGFARLFRRFELWPLALASVRWPPAPSKRAGTLAALERMGMHCRGLVVEGLLGGVEDLPLLARRCPSVKDVVVTGIGVEGVETEVWKLWGSSLRRASLGFLYDAVDGPPAIREVLADLVALCPQLEALSIVGMDWLTAREGCLGVLIGSPGQAPNLRFLSLFGSEAQLGSEALKRLGWARPGLRVRSKVLPAPNLDW